MLVLLLYIITNYYILLHTRAECKTCTYIKDLLRKKYKKHSTSRICCSRSHKYVVCVKDCSFEDKGVKLKDHLCYWLAAAGKELVTNWFHKWWCLDVTGCWLLGNGWYCLITNNLAMESSWRWQCNSISC